MIGLPLFLLATAPQSFFFVRHGETQANATGHYSKSTIDSFSPRGVQEVSVLTDQLLKMPRFGMILVSPAPRTLRTIAPYLQRTHQKAYVWSLLYECCTGKRPRGVHPAKFGFGSQISIPTDLRPYFLLMRGETKYPTAATYAQGLGQVDAAVQEFKERYGGKNVLLVGHSGQGGHFIHELTQKWMKLDNAQLHKISVR